MKKILILILSLFSLNILCSESTELYVKIGKKYKKLDTSNSDIKLAATQCGFLTSTPTRVELGHYSSAPKKLSGGMTETVPCHVYVELNAQAAQNMKSYYQGELELKI